MKEIGLSEVKEVAQGHVGVRLIGAATTPLLRCLSMECFG